MQASLVHIPHSKMVLPKGKLRHILEIGLTLLTFSFVKKIFGRCISYCYAYIINKLPTPILDHTPPYSKLYNKEPDYQVLCVFNLGANASYHISPSAIWFA